MEDRQTADYTFLIAAVVLLVFTGCLVGLVPGLGDMLLGFLLQTWKAL